MPNLVLEMLAGRAEFGCKQIGQTALGGLRMTKSFFLATALTICAAIPALGQFTKVVEDAAEQPIPESFFFGDAPFVSEPDTLSLDPIGETKAPFLRATVRWAHTAKATTAGEIIGNWGGIDIPIGTRFYAIRFKDGFKSQIEREEKAGAKIPNVAWCTPDIKPEKNDPYCLFLSRTGRDVGIANSGAGTAFYPEYMGIGGHGLSIAPTLERTDVTFDRALTLEAEVRRIRKSKVKFRVSLDDGDEDRKSVV